MAAPCQLGMYITTVEHRLLRDDGCATASLPDAPSHPRKFLECRESIETYISGEGKLTAGISAFCVSVHGVARMAAHCTEIGIAR